MSVRHAFLAASALAVAPLPAHAVPLIGVTVGNQLVGFDSAAPGTIGSTLAVTGLGAGESLLGIDTRPAGGALYGLGSSGQLYAIDTATGAAAASGSPLSLSGSNFGLGFNPTVDRLRVVSNADQNLRVNVDTGAAITDGTLAYAAGDANAGRNPNVTAVAYTNQEAGTAAASTLLYGIDTGTSTLVQQNPANAGTLATIGALGFNAGNMTGFDIAGGVAYASLGGQGGNSLYTISLSDGTATRIGAIGGPVLTGLAAGQLGAVAVPEPASVALLGLSLAGLMVARRRVG